MATSNFQNAVMQHGPIGYWRLGDSAVPIVPTDPNYPWYPSDTSGKENIGNCIGQGITFGKPGLVRGIVIPGKAPVGDTAALFDGKEGRIIVLNSISLNPSPHLTMEAIIRWDGPNTYDQRILEKSSYIGEAQYSLQILDSGHFIRVELRTGDNNWARAQSNTPLVQGRGYHIAATYEGTNIQIYIDGSSDSQTPTVPATGTLSTKPPLPANLIESGVGIGNETQRDRPFNGLIDEVALYPTALTGAQILAHYKSNDVTIRRPVPLPPKK